MTYRLAFSAAPFRDMYRDFLVEGLTDAELDQGSRSIDYDTFSLRTARGSGNHRIDADELMEALFSRTDAASRYARYFGESLPWLPGTSTLSQTVLTRFDAEVAAWRGELGLPARVNEDLARRIFDWVTSASGLSIRPIDTLVERSFDETLSDGRGDCSELSRVLFTLLSRAGFSPYPVFVGRDEGDDPITHGVIGLDLGGQTYLLDLAHGNFNAPHHGYERLSLREYVAWYWNNRGIQHADTRPDLARTEYDRAVEMDPRNPHFLTNRGLLRAEHGDVAGARADYAAALRSAPGYAPAHFELGNLEYDEGHFSSALPHYRRAIRLWPETPDYRRNLILALHELGRAEEARTALTALRALGGSHSDLAALVGAE